MSMFFWPIKFFVFDADSHRTNVTSRVKLVTVAYVNSAFLNFECRMIGGWYLVLSSGNGCIGQ